MTTSFCIVLVDVKVGIPEEVVFGYTGTSALLATRNRALQNVQSEDDWRKNGCSGR